MSDDARSLFAFLTTIAALATVVSGFLWCIFVTDSTALAALCSFFYFDLITFLLLTLVGGGNAIVGFKRMTERTDV